MRDEQPDNLRLLAARVGASTAAAASSLDGKVQRGRSPSVGLMHVRPTVKKHASGRSAACAHRTM
jgi:hypothetical protein